MNNLIIVALGLLVGSIVFVIVGKLVEIWVKYKKNKYKKKQ